MSWLTSLPAGALAVGWLLLTLVVAAGSRVGVRALVPAGERDHVPGIAAPLMPALGAAFAVMMALTLASEAGYLRSAQDDVSAEAAQASRLAWAATSAGVRTEPIHAALRRYLEATRADEWRGRGAAEEPDPDTAAAIRALERAVRPEAVRAELGTPTGTELLAALDAVTTARRTRLAAASRELPDLYVVTLVVTGMALVANAGALAFRSSLRTSALVLGLGAAVACSLALLFALTAPWDGAMAVGDEPLGAIVRDLDAGFFHR